MYTVFVYRGRAHWHKPIDEITEYFDTEQDATDYVNLIRKYKQKYYFEIISDTERRAAQ